MTEKRVFTMQADIDLLELFKATCESNDETQSQVVRKFMREYINKNEQPDIFITSEKS